MRGLLWGRKGDVERALSIDLVVAHFGLTAINTKERE